MALTFNLETVTDLYKKLERDARALDEKVTSDRLFNFVVTGYSLIDWIKNDPSIAAAAKNDTKCLYEDRWLKVCGDLATACKHFKIDQRPPITSNTSSSTGFGMGRYGKGVYGIGEESIEIKLNDGSSFQCDELVSNVLSTWKCFFTTHSISIL